MAFDVNPFVSPRVPHQPSRGRQPPSHTHKDSHHHSTPKSIDDDADYEYDDEEDKEETIFHTNLLPPKLTTLGLHWRGDVTPDFELASFNIKTLSLVFEGGRWYRARFGFTAHFLSLPPSLTYLSMQMIQIIGPYPDISVSRTLLPNLDWLHARGASYEWFEHVPRSVKHFEIGFLYDLYHLPLLADGQRFKHLPSSLTTLRLPWPADDYPDKFELLPQELDALPSLTDLWLNCTTTVPSRMIRNLPPTLKRLQINVTEFSDDDLPFLPPNLEKCKIAKPTAELVKRMTLASLALLELDDKMETSSALRAIARERVRLTAAHQ